VAGAAASIIPAAIAPAAADAELIALGDRLAPIFHTINSPAGAGREDALYLEGSAIVDRIFALRATTIAGAKAKCQALFWVHGDRAEFWECRHSFDLVADVLAIEVSAGV
jgi:hypothetical protein